MVVDLIAALDSLHVPTTDFCGRRVCAHCAELCHSHSGLMCDDDGDGAWPCATMEIVNRYMGRENVVPER